MKKLLVKNMKRGVKVSALMLVSSIMANNVFAEHSLYRVVWKQDPAHEVTIGWRNEGGTNHRVIIGTSVDETTWMTYRVTDSFSLGTLASNFVDISGLTADTRYYFKVCDNTGCTAQKYFYTAPDTPKPITFVAGGDSRSNTAARRNGNMLVPKLRPLFVAFGGDYMSNSARDSEMVQWLQDWQLTEASDGRVFPIVPTMGNHENDDYGMMQEIFNVPLDEANNVYYNYAMSIGGSMMRLYTLNSEVKKDDLLWNAQIDWLATDLANNSDQHIWNVTQYHHSIMPHTTSKPSVYSVMLDDLVPLFTQYGMDLSIECDSHVVKSTFPASKGGNELVRDDVNGTVFIGEGTWGTTPRSSNRDTAVTRAKDSFNQIKYIQVNSSKMDVRTVKTISVADVASLSQAEQDASAFAMPDGLNLWAPAGVGEVLTLEADLGGGGPDSINQKPVAQINGPYTGIINHPVTFTAIGSVDPDGSIVSYMWDFGNNTTDQGQHLDYTYAEPGNYTVKLTVVDNQSQAESSKTTATIFNSGNESEAQISLDANEDTFIALSLSSTNYNENREGLLADGRDSTYGSLMSLVKFDVSVLPECANVTDAILSIHVTNKSRGGYLVYNGERSWNEATATWDSVSGDEVKGEIAAEFSPLNTGYMNVQINTAGVLAINRWLDDSNNGFVIASGGTGDGLDFSSSEQRFVPKLQLTYTKQSGCNR